MAASVGLAPYTTTTVIVAAALVALAGGLVAGRESVLRSRMARPAGTGWWAQRRAAALAARALPPDDPVRRRMWIASELVFLVAFAVMALLVAYSPDVWGTEKPMDMAFVNAANASDSFPPHDPWMAGRTSTTTTSATSRWRW